MTTATVTTRQLVDKTISTAPTHFHGSPKFEQTRSSLRSVPKPASVSAAKSAQPSLLTRLAQQCDVPQSAVQDAYPCSPFQTVRIRESVAVTGLRHSHQVYALREEIQEHIALFERCWQYAYKRNPIMRTRVASIGNSSSGKETLVQVVVEDEFRWQVVDDTKTYQHSEHFTNPLKPGAPLVYFAIDKALTHFVLTMHHALYDAYTLSLIWADVKEAWSANGEVAGAVPRPSYNRFIGYLQKPPSDGISDRWTQPSQSAKDDEETREWPNATQVAGGVFPIHTPLPESGNVRHTAVIKAAWACTLMEALKTNDIVFPDYFTGRCCPVPGILDIAGPTICAFPFRVQSKPDVELSQVLAEVQGEITDILQREHWGDFSPNASAYTPTSGQYGLNVINVFQDADDKQENMWLNGLEPVAGQFAFRGGWDYMTRVIMQKHQIIWTFFADNSRLGDEVSGHIRARFPELLKLFSDPKNQERKMTDLINV